MKPYRVIMIIADLSDHTLVSIIEWYIREIYIPIYVDFYCM